MTLQNWYEFNFPISETFNWEMVNDVEYRKQYNFALGELISLMTSANIKHWWFLHYGSYILVRFKKTKTNSFKISEQYTISKYIESNEKWKSKIELGWFVNIMQICKDMAIARYKDSGVYDVGRFSERMWHCSWNVLHGIGSEIKFHNTLLSDSNNLMKLNLTEFNKCVFEL